MVVLPGALLCTAAIVLATPAPAEAVTVFKGRWLCKDRGHVAPIREARVQLVRVIGDSDRVVDRGWTRPDHGSFSLKAPSRVRANHYVLLELRDRQGARLSCKRVRQVRVWAAETCGDPRYRPRDFALSCDGAFRIEALRWGSWDAEYARGRGTAVVNTCRPDCSRGTYVRYPVAVRLSDARTCESTGLRQYRRFAYTFSRGVPAYHDRRESRRLNCTFFDRG